MKNDLISIMDIILYGEFSNKNLIELYNILGYENFIKVCKMFSNRTLKIPDYEELKEAFVTASIYYYKIIENLDWDTIKKKMGKDFNNVNYKQKINYVNKILNKEIKGFYEEKS